MDHPGSIEKLYSELSNAKKGKVYDVKNTAGQTVKSFTINKIATSMVTFDQPDSDDDSDYEKTVLLTLIQVMNQR